MGMPEYQEAKDIMLRNTGRAHFAGPRPARLLDKAEQVLGIRFPASYRAFLLDFGAGSFGSFEIYGIIGEDFENSSVPDAIWFTLTERREVDLPADMLVIGDAGTGELYCLRTLPSDREGAVVLIDPGAFSTDSIGQQVAQDFGYFILENVQRQLSH